MPRLDVTQIHEGLYQGGWPPFGAELSKRGFDALILAAEENQHADYYDGVEVIRAPGRDVEDEELLRQYLPGWQATAGEVATLVKDGNVVLVTCMAGLNRSGVVTAIALNALTGWGGERCVEHIQQKREMALCNDTFAAWLKRNLAAFEP